MVNDPNVVFTSQNPSDFASLYTSPGGTGSTLTSGFTNGQPDDKLTSPGGSVEVVNDPNVVFTSQNPSDAAKLYTSPGGSGSGFISSATNGQIDFLTGPGYFVEAVNCTNITCISQSSYDVANLASNQSGLGSNFVSRFINGQSDDLLTGPGYAVEAVNFARVKFNSQNPSDTAKLSSNSVGTGSTFTSGFTNGRSDDFLTGPGYSVEAVNDPTVFFTSQNPSDAAKLYTSPTGSGSGFTSSDTSGLYDYLTGTGYFVAALYDPHVLVTSQNPYDAAYLAERIGGNGSTFASNFNTAGAVDNFTGRHGYAVEAVDFNLVVCTSNNSGRDVAYLYSAGLRVRLDLPGQRQRDRPGS